MGQRLPIHISFAQSQNPRTDVEFDEGVLELVKHFADQDDALHDEVLFVIIFL